MVNVRANVGISLTAIEFGPTVLRSVLKVPLGFSCMQKIEKKNRKHKGKNCNDISKRSKSVSATKCLEMAHYRIVSILD